MSIITKAVLTAAAVLLSTVGLTVALSPQQADAAAPRSPRCMTKAEWRRIPHGATRAQVRRITGIPGRVSNTIEHEDGTHDVAIDFQQCTRKGKPARGSWNRVSVYFTDYTYDADYNMIRRPLAVDFKGSWSSPVVFS